MPSSPHTRALVSHAKPDGGLGILTLQGKLYLKDHPFGKRPFHIVPEVTDIEDIGLLYNSLS